MKKLYSFRHRGAALIVVLSIIVLVSGLVVGLAMAMRMERSASYYHLERMRADLLARQGVDYGQALINAATTNGRFWVSGPGRIYASAENTFGLPTTLIDLSSEPTKDTNSTASADINRAGYEVNERLLNPGGTNFNVKWIYVTKTGAYITNTTPTMNSNIVGRFAFWVDDENSRVNLSTASQRTADSQDWAKPSQINLASLNDFSSYVATVTSRTVGGTLNTPNELLGMSNLPAGLSNAIISNRFNITHYNQDPEIDPWGRGKIVLTTLAGRAYLRDTYFNILTSTNGNPGFLGSLVETNVSNSLNTVMERLLHTHWPLVGDVNASWATKYGTNGAAQLALDVVEYVRSTESTNVFVEPLTATLTSTNLTFAPTLTVDTFPANGLIGTTRRPAISEMGVWLDAQTNAASSNNFPGKLYVEVYLPSGYGIAATNFPAAYTYYLKSSIKAAEVVVPTLVTNGTNGVSPFVRFEQDIFLSPSPANSTNRPTNVALRVALLKDDTGSASSILDVAPLSSLDSINYEIDATNVVQADIHSVEVRDPRVNKHVANWAKHASSNSFGSVNSQWTTLIAPPTGMPPADTTSGGAMSTDSVVIPYSATNIGAIVGSVGELGYINTGVATDMPWRSVRLQPSGSTSSTNVLPDWALLELFSAPVTNSINVPGTNLVSGRVNLNALIRSAAGTNMSRTNVLRTLMPDTFVLTGNSNANATVISNVINATNLADEGLNFANSTQNQMYLSVGQLAEMRGISDSGEASEKVIRQIASLGTVRSDVFSVYSVGQALKVTPAGKVLVNGEKMVRAIVERTYAAGEVPQYRVIYWSEIYP